MRFACQLALACALLVFVPSFASAQEPEQNPQKFDPLVAEKDVEVGQFYLKKGNYDAAIERFRHAINNRPNFAIPHKLIGEAYEKKGFKEEAVQAYEKYLEILPHAEDGDKIRKKIKELKEAIEREKTRKKNPT